MTSYRRVFWILLALALCAGMGYTLEAYLLNGNGPFLSWRRSFRLFGLFLDAYALALLLVVLLPATVLATWRALMELGLAARREAVIVRGNFLVTLFAVAMIIVAVRFQVWEDLLGGGSSGLPAPPSDAKLEFPALPLQPKAEKPWILKDLNGKELAFADLKGRAVFLNCWATWCGFCKAEFPNIQRLHAAMKDTPNLAFMLVTEEEPEVVQKWLASEEGKPYAGLPFYMTEEIPAAYAPRGWPTTYFIAPDGQIAFQHSGFAAWDGDKTKDFLTRLAKP